MPYIYILLKKKAKAWLKSSSSYYTPHSSLAIFISLTCQSLCGGSSSRLDRLLLSSSPNRSDTHTIRGGFNSIIAMVVGAQPKPQPQSQPQQLSQQQPQKLPQQQPETSAEEEALKRNTDCVYFLASPVSCKKVRPFFCFEFCYRYNCFGF